jgi:hypothetical protein
MGVKMTDHPHATAVKLVTCASVEDAQGAKKLLDECPDVSAVAMALAGLMWTTVQTLADELDVPADHCWRQFIKQYERLTHLLEANGFMPGFG